MTNKQRMLCVQEVERYTDRETYVSEVARSSIFLGGESIPQERLEALGRLWDACHRSVKEIAQAAGMSQRKLAERFAIPYRSVENWSGGISQCPPYVRLMMQEILTKQAPPD
jgi:DNA-binding transcriptional regulator YiaG